MEIVTEWKIEKQFLSNDFFYTFRNVKSVHSCCHFLCISNYEKLCSCNYHLHKLIKLRHQLQKGEVHLESYAKSDKIPAELQERQFNMKVANLTKCLDCFLFMISTGMYHADIMKSKMHFSVHGNGIHARYRRSKNGSLCKAIPIQNDDIFIGMEIKNQYKIKDNSNFPLNLSLTHFAKHLDRISELAEVGVKLNNKMARKTFASVLYFNRRLPIHLLQILLGHQDVRDTQHYLRISDDDVANEILKCITINPSK